MRKKLIIGFVILAFAIAYMMVRNPKHTSTQISLALGQELPKTDLEVQGVVPTWLNGFLIRNGPVNVSIDGKTNAHWFDGLAMLHRFDFKDGKVTYNNRFLRTDAYKKVFEEKSLDYGGFLSTKKEKNSLEKLLPNLSREESVKIPNANVNVAKIGDSFAALTEVPPPVTFNPESLETLGVLQYDDQLPKDHYWVSAHPHHNAKRKEMINYLVKYGNPSSYQIYRIKDGSKERKLIAEIPVEKPSYMHSFSVTKNYIILTEYPFLVNPSDLKKGDRPFIKNFVWEPQQKTRFIVIDRKDGTVLGKYLYKPFFAFHHANAFEKNGKIFVDIITYETPLIVYQEGDEFRVNKKPAMQKAAESKSKVERFSLDLKTGEMDSEDLLKDSADFPRINPLRDGKTYHYLYLVDSRDMEEIEEQRPIYKLDTDTKEVTRWSKPGNYPGEAIFVANPDAEKEDDGVILSLVFDNKNYRSYLLILDASNMEELAEIAIPHIIPPGLHGEFYSQ